MFDFINDGGYDYCTAGTLIYVLYASLRPAVSAVRERLANSELFSMRARVCVVCFECDECAHLLACDGMQTGEMGSQKNLLLL